MVRRTEPVAGGNGQQADGGAAHGDLTGRIVSVAEAIDRYPGQWMLMEVLEQIDFRPARGRLLAHSATRDEIDALEIRLLREKAPRDGPYYLFEGYHLITTIEGLRKLIEEAYTMDADDERWDAHFDLHES